MAGAKFRVFGHSRSSDSLASMWEFSKFVTSVLKHWGSIVTSGALIGGLGLWQSTGHFVAHWVYWSVAAIGLLVALYRAWLGERQQVVALKTRLGIETTKLGQESEQTAQLRKEITNLAVQSENEHKKELVKAITVLHSMQSNVLYWKDILKDRWGMVPASVKLLPDDWSTIVYAAEKISPELRKNVDVLENYLVQANSLVQQFLDMPVTYRDQKLPPRAYILLDQAAPILFTVTSEIEAFEKSLRSRTVA